MYSKRLFIKHNKKYSGRKLSTASVKHKHKCAASMKIWCRIIMIGHARYELV